MDEAEMVLLLDLIEGWDRWHRNGSVAADWTCADIFGAPCYRLDSLAVLEQR